MLPDIPDNLKSTSEEIKISTLRFGDARSWQVEAGLRQPAIRSSLSKKMRNKQRPAFEFKRRIVLLLLTSAL